MNPDHLEESRWNKAILHEVRAQMRDAGSPIELVSASATSDHPWLRLVYRTRVSNTQLIGRILPLAPTPPATLSPEAGDAADAAARIVALISDPLTDEQRAASTFDADGVLWLEDPSTLRRPDDDRQSMSFVSKAEFAEIWERANPGVPLPAGTAGIAHDE